MRDERRGDGGPVGRRFLAYGVHALTASGAVLALLALEATLAGRLDRAFVWLGLALIIDGIDGTLARQVDIKTHAPLIDGTVLDLVVDYATYVFVPAVMLLTGGFLPQGTVLFTTAIVLATAALYFADTRMKTVEGGFRGFPALWNLLVFYLAVFRPDPMLALFIVIGCAIAQFVPLPFVHPMRVRAFRATNLAMLAAWSVAALVAVAQWGAIDPLVRVVLAATALWLVLALPLARLLSQRKR